MEPDTIPNEPAANGESSVDMEAGTVARTDPTNNRLVTEVGARLKAVRGHRTQREVAERVRSTKMSVSRYESGERVPDAVYLATFCTEFDVDAGWLLLGKGVPPSVTVDLPATGTQGP